MDFRPGGECHSIPQVVWKGSNDIPRAVVGCIIAKFQIPPSLSCNFYKTRNDLTTAVVKNPLNLTGNPWNPLPSLSLLRRKATRDAETTDPNLDGAGRADRTSSLWPLTPARRLYFEQPLFTHSPLGDVTYFTLHYSSCNPRARLYYAPRSVSPCLLVQRGNATFPLRNGSADHQPNIQSLFPSFFNPFVTLYDVLKIYDGRDYL